MTPESIEKYLLEKLNGEFNGKMINQVNIESIHNYTHAMIKDILAELGNSQLFTYVKFSVSGYGDGNVNLNPGNFFTFLLLNGIFEPNSAGNDSYVLERPEYSICWIDNAGVVVEK